MSIAQEFIRELDYELPASRRLMSRVPTEHAVWKPHPKSSPLGHLVQLLARMPGTMADIVRGIDMDLGAMPAYSFEETHVLLELFDANSSQLHEALRVAGDDVFARTWHLKYGDQVLEKGVRKDVLRNTINHFVHHRGQLTVYLRLKDVALPCLYGPTADEKW
jgi:DinB family